MSKSFNSKLVPVLAGDQSYIKTAAISRIFNIFGRNAGTFLEGAALDPESKDSIFRAIKHWAVELAELEQTTKRGQGELKAFITSPEDVLRLPYARSETRKPRQTNFIATVNGTGFLKDETGSTRFAVLKMAGKVDIERLNTLLGWKWGQQAEMIKPELLKQFWLEVKTLYDDGHNWFLPEDVSHKFSNDINDKHTDKGGYYQMLLENYTVDDTYKDDPKWVTATDISQMENIPKNQVVQVGKALSKLVKERKLEFKKVKGKSYYLCRCNQHLREQ